MQEKIERIIGASLGAACPEKVAAAEIAALFERKVIWECDEVTVRDGWVWFNDAERQELRKALEKLPDGQRVRMIMEDIE